MTPAGGPRGPTSGWTPGPGTATLLLGLGAVLLLLACGFDDGPGFGAAAGVLGAFWLSCGAKVVVDLRRRRRETPPAPPPRPAPAEDAEAEARADARPELVP